MDTATFVFMIATYWVGGSAIEGGKYLANGQPYVNKEFVAAHRTLPFGTILNVCLRRKCVSVVVKDRGPFLPKMNVGAASTCHTPLQRPSTCFMTEGSACV